ncbi:MAG: hypothetical protein AAFX65_10635 [Cyanobacteria bacterium J06638_7]
MTGTTRRRRARVEEGRYRADDPSTPDVNEAWEELSPKPSFDAEAFLGLSGREACEQALALAIRTVGESYGRQLPADPTFLPLTQRAAVRSLAQALVRSGAPGTLPPVLPAVVRLFLSQPF